MIHLTNVDIVQWCYIVQAWCSSCKFRDRI